MRVIGTWKNKLSYTQSVALATRLASWINEIDIRVQLTILPPTIALAEVRRILPKQVDVGCQNCIWDAENSFTGETTAASVRDAGGAVVMSGHSERRIYLSETDEQIAAKVATTVNHGLIPLICVGETYEERVRNQTARVLETQFERLLPIICATGPGSAIIAYEPAWAITTSEHKLPANPSLAAQDHAWIRNHLVERLGEQGKTLELIYGAGVNIENVTDFLATPAVDGVLIGSASQKFESFARIIEKANMACIAMGE